MQRILQKGYVDRKDRPKNTSSGQKAAESKRKEKTEFEHRVASQALIQRRRQDVTAGSTRYEARLDLRGRAQKRVDNMVAKCEKRVLAYIELNVGGGKTETVVFRQGDTAEGLAEQLGRGYGIRSED